MLAFNLFDPIQLGTSLGYKAGVEAGQALSSGENPVTAVSKSVSGDFNILKNTGLYVAGSVASIPEKIGETVTGAVKGLGGFVTGTLTKTIIILALVLVGFLIVNALIKKGVEA